MFCCSVDIAYIQTYSAMFVLCLQGAVYVLHICRHVLMYTQHDAAFMHTYRQFCNPRQPFARFFCLVTVNVVPWLYIAFTYCLHKLLQSAVLQLLLIQA